MIVGGGMLKKFTKNTNNKVLGGLIKPNKYMATSKLFQYAILWHPTEKQVKEDGAKSKVLVDLKTILAADTNSAAMAAAMEIPADKKSELDQIEIALRPF